MHGEAGGEHLNQGSWWSAESAVSDSGIAVPDRTDVPLNQRPDVSFKTQDTSRTDYLFLVTVRRRNRPAWLRDRGGVQCS